MRFTSSMLFTTAIVLGLSLTACSDSNEVTLHEPGEYKGAVDPLIEKQASAEQQEKLIQRFNQIQTDR